MQRSESYICPETPSSLLGKGGFCRLRAVLRQSALCGVGPLLVAGLVACFSFSVEAAAPAPGAACTEYGESSSSCYKNGCYICSGGVWVAQALQIGASSASCATGLAGTLRWTGSSLEQCNGSAWASLGCGGVSAAFSFTDRTGVNTGVTISSNALKITGFAGEVTATCNGACSAIARNGVWGGTGVSGFVDGDTIAIRQTSSSTLGATTTASVTVGSTTSGTWSVTTMASDPCAATSPTAGAICADGSVYVGLSPDGNVKMYAMRCDVGQVWDETGCTGTRATKQWGTFNATTGYTSSTTGKANTAGLVATYGTTTDTRGTYGTPPASACKTATSHGHADWYLPASSELNLIYTNRAALGNTLDMSGAYYWSSSEYTSFRAYAQRLNDGYQYGDDKSLAYTVRCVRR